MENGLSSFDESLIVVTEKAAVTDASAADADDAGAVIIPSADDAEIGLVLKDAAIDGQILKVDLSTDGGESSAATNDFQDGWRIDADADQQPLAVSASSIKVATTEEDAPRLPPSHTNETDGEDASPRLETDAEVDADAEVDVDGYHVEERKETETTSRTEEIRETPERTEVRTREVKEVTLEEVKSRETTRPVSDEEFRALLEAAFDKTEELEFGRNVTIDEFTRVESEREEASGGKVTTATISVKEEHKTEEIQETVQFGKISDGQGQGSCEEEKPAAASEDAAQDRTDEDASVDATNTQPDEAVAVQSSETNDSDKQDENQITRKVQDAAEPAPASATAAVTEDKSDKEPELATASAATEDKNDKDKGAKSKGLIGYIKAKTRSLSRDRNHKTAVLAVGKEGGEEAPKAGGSPTKDETKRSPKKDKEGHSGEDAAEKKEGKKFKLNLFGKKSEDGEQKKSDVEGTEGVAEKSLTGAAATTEKETGGEKPKKSKLGFMKIGGGGGGKQKQQELVAESHSGGRKTPEHKEADGEKESPNEESGKEQPERESEEKEKEKGKEQPLKDDQQKKSKEHKKFSFGINFGKKSKKSHETETAKPSSKDGEEPKSSEEKQENVKIDDDIVAEPCTRIVLVTDAPLIVIESENIETAVVAVSEQSAVAPQTESAPEEPLRTTGEVEVKIEEAGSREEGEKKEQEIQLLPDASFDVVGDTIPTLDREDEIIKEDKSVELEGNVCGTGVLIETDVAVTNPTAKEKSFDEVTVQEVEKADEETLIVTEEKRVTTQPEAEPKGVLEYGVSEEKSDEAVEQETEQKEVDLVMAQEVQEQAVEGVATEPHAEDQRKDETKEEVLLGSKDDEAIVRETAQTSPKKDQKQTQRFSFGLKFGHKKEAKPEEESPRHKAWSPFAKKPAKKEKSEDEGGISKEVATPEDDKPAAVSEEEGGEKGGKDGEKADAQPPQSDSREGTLKRNKGIHKFFSFGKKTKSLDTEPGEPGKPELVSVEKVAGDESTASDDKKPVTAVAASSADSGKHQQDGKHHQRKFSFGLKFGKKHERENDHEQQKKIDEPEKEKTNEERDVKISEHDGERKEGQEPLTIIENKLAIELNVKPVNLEIDQVSATESKQEAVESANEEKVQDDTKGEEFDLDQPTSEMKYLGGLVDEIMKCVVQPQVEIDGGLMAISSEPKETEEHLSSGISTEIKPHNFEVTVGQPGEIEDLEVKAIQETDGTTLEAGAPKPGVEVSIEIENRTEVKAEKVVSVSQIGELSVEPNVSVASETLLEVTGIPDVTVVPDSITTPEVTVTPVVPVVVVTSEVGANLEAPPTSELPAESTKTEQKKSIFGIRFGKKAKQSASREKVNEITEQQEKDGVTEERNVPINGSDGDRDKSAEAAAAAGTDSGSRVEELIIEVEVKEIKDEDAENGAVHQHHHGIKWPHFGGKKSSNKKDETGKKKTVEEVLVSSSVDAQLASSTPAAEAEADVDKKDDSLKTTVNHHENGSSKKSSKPIGKGLLKIFSPKKHLKSDKDKSSDHQQQQQESFVVYSIVADDEIVAETHWRPKMTTIEVVPVASKTEARDKKKKNPPSSSPELIQTNGTVDHDNIEGEHFPPCGTLLNGDSSLPEDIEKLQVSDFSSVVDDVPPTSGSTSGPGHFIVVAIDFGTTFSGYAFSFINDPDSIHMMRKWEGGDPGVVNQKTPTTILLTPDGVFHSFGFTARDFYHDLDSTEADRWMYFEKFKMALHHNTELNQETTITSSNGKEFSAMKIFSYALRFFRDHALKELTSQSSVTIDNDDVRWVITVPAIWKAPAKQFMRQAAYEAGIAAPSHPDRLLIALEPEAASIYVRRLRMSQLIPDRPVSPVPLTPPRGSPLADDAEVDHLSTPPLVIIADHVSDHLKAGTRYMIVDCGGGTVDVTVHEMETAKGHLRELYKATGGPYGSTGVDRDFERLLNDIFGSEFIESFKQKRPAGWVDLMIAFESRKRAANPHRDNPLNVSLPFSFIDFYKKQFGCPTETAIKKFGDKDVSWSLQGMLRLKPEAMHRLFQPTLDSIKNAISDVLYNPEVKGIEYLFLVGGFSESPMLQYEIRKAFEDNVKLIIPQDVSLTILKGAVCFGLDPTLVTVRKSRMTYGVGVVNRFDPARHPESRRVEKDGTDWCTGIFDTFVRAGESTALGDRVRRRYAPANRDQRTTVVHVYASESGDVRFVDDVGVERCATLRLDLLGEEEVVAKEKDGEGEGPAKASPTMRREIETTMTFGGTEIRLTARDVDTGRAVASTIDFLNK